MARRGRCSAAPSNWIPSSVSRSSPLFETGSAGLAAARAGFDMGIPFNDLNRAFDLGFRPLPWGDQGYIPRAMQPVTEAKGTSVQPKGPKSKVQDPLGCSRNDVFTRLTSALTT